MSESRIRRKRPVLADQGARLEEVLEPGREALLSLVVEFGLEAFGEML